MAFTDQHTLYLDATFRGRVKVALAKIATQIAGEDPTGMKGRKSRKRQALASHILNDPDGYLDRFALATVTNAAITGAATDGDIEFQLSAVFDDFAAVDFDER